jgi:hypothetical protein
MDKREQAFWEWYDPIKETADRHGVEIYQLVNARQIWDMAYSTGKVDAMNEVAEIMKPTVDTNAA